MINPLGLNLYNLLYLLGVSFFLNFVVPIPTMNEFLFLIVVVSYSNYV